MRQPAAPAGKEFERRGDGMGRLLQRNDVRLVALTAATLVVAALDLWIYPAADLGILFAPLCMLAVRWYGPRVGWLYFSVAAVMTLAGGVNAVRISQHPWSHLTDGLGTIVITAVVTWLVVQAARREQILSELNDSLRCSQEQLRHFVEQVPAAVAMFDRDMRYLAHSRRWLQLSPQRDKHADSLLGTLHYAEIATFPEHWKEAHRRAMAGESVRCEHDVMKTPDGQEEVGRWEAIPWFDRTGQVGGVLLFVEQITERAQIERQLRDSEALYRSLVEHIPRGVFRKDLEGRYTFANQLFCEMLGKPLEKLLGTTDDDHFRWELAAKHRDEEQQIIVTGSVLNVVEEHKSPDKPPRYIRIVKTRLVDGDGRIIGTQGITWDVTEYHLERASLRNVAREFRTLAENLPDIIVRYDRQLRLVYFNRAVEGIAGIPPELFIGKRNAEIDMPDDLAQLSRREGT